MVIRYIISLTKKKLIVCLYVDDMIYTINLMMENFILVMKIEFEMTDLGLMKYFLIGIKVEQIHNDIFLCQHKYAKNVLNRFRMTTSKPSYSPVVTCIKLSKQDQGTKIDTTLHKRLFGSMMYLIDRGPETMYAISLISRISWKFQKILICR